MNKIQLIDKLKIYPLFTFNDFIRITKKRREYARTLLYRLRKENIIYKIEKGKYTLHEDPLIFASYIQLPSYISFWTALRFYNFTEQLPNEITIATKKARDEINFLGNKIKFIKMKSFFGYRKERYGEFYIFIADKEKAIIDSLLIKNVPLDEIIKAIKSRIIDNNKLINYAIKTKNKALIKRLGFLLERNGYKCKVLKKYIDYNYILLDPMFEEKGEKNNEWKIIVNRSI